ncbi:hypothetical protein KAR91_75785 [Candidatus Pacearchaeota archaeon]|nr:hypothetical protein [Candidatus Pacearchaeota archaeon]
MTFTREAIRNLNPIPLSRREQISQTVLQAFAAKLRKKPDSFFTETGPKVFKFSFMVYGDNEERPKYNT